ncbi:MAG: HAD family hydrolase [Syntrophorhabdales bacterium]
MKKVISFDLDGTIVDGAYGNMVWLEGIPEKYAERYGLPVGDAKRAVKSAYDSIGEADLLWYDIDYWLRRFGLAVRPEDLLEEYVDHIRLLPHVAEVVRELKEKYALVIASNAARPFVEKELRRTGLEGCFSHIVSATSDLRMVKKEEGFYRELCRLLGVSPAEMAHVGDHAVFDMEVPLRVGIDAFLYDPAAPRNGRILHDFRELLDRL